MGNGFDDVSVQMEGISDQLFPITGGGGSTDPDPVPAETVNVFQLFLYQGNRFPIIGLIEIIQDVTVRCDQNQLDGGGTGIDA